MFEGSDRPLLVTSGVALPAAGRTATEEDAPLPTSTLYPRASDADETPYFYAHRKILLIQEAF